MGLDIHCDTDQKDRCSNHHAPAVQQCHGESLVVVYCCVQHILICLVSIPCAFYCSKPSSPTLQINNDIALIRVSSPVNLDLPGIMPVCLPSSTDNFENKNGIVTGWGTLTHGEAVSSCVHMCHIHTFATYSTLLCCHV